MMANIALADRAEAISVHLASELAGVVCERRLDPEPVAGDTEPTDSREQLDCMNNLGPLRQNNVGTSDRTERTVHIAARRSCSACIIACCRFTRSGTTLSRATEGTNSYLSTPNPARTPRSTGEWSCQSGRSNRIGALRCTGGLVMIRMTRNGF